MWKYTKISMAIYFIVETGFPIFYIYIQMYFRHYVVKITSIYCSRQAGTVVYVYVVHCTVYCTLYTFYK